MLPARRKSLKSGIERVPEYRYPGHRRYVRRFVCSVPGCPVTETVAAHYRGGGTSGTGGSTSKKPPDWWILSLCHACHALQGNIGEAPFMAKTGLDMEAMATEFARKSPVPGVRAMAGVRL